MAEKLNALNPSGGGKAIVDIVYPVGSIYMSVNSTSPSTLFGGTWEQLENRFLIGAGDTYTAGSKGGEATHTLTRSELPGSIAVIKYMNYGGAHFGTIVESNPSAWTVATNDEDINISTGSAHNNLPPYIAVYMWKRTA